MADSPNQFTLKMSGNGLSIDKEISEQLAHEIAVFVLSEGKFEPNTFRRQHGQRAAPPGQHGAKRPHGTSPQEFLQQTGAKNGEQKITALGSYLLASASGKRSFSQDELREAFESAKEKVPGNLSRDINKSIRSGWIARVTGEKDAYYVTSSGSAAMNGQFPKASKKRKKAKKKSSTVKTK